MEVRPDPANAVVRNARAARSAAAGLAVVTWWLTACGQAPSTNQGGRSSGLSGLRPGSPGLSGVAGGVAGALAGSPGAGLAGSVGPGSAGAAGVPGPTGTAGMLGAAGGAGMLAAAGAGMLGAAGGAGTLGASGSAAGLAGAAPAPSQPGAPIAAAPMRWQYVHFPSAICRDGKETGLAINPNPGSDKLLIFLDGGGACFNRLACTANPRSWGAADVGRITIRRADARNPFRDWNLVFVPYCTGDVFSGAATHDTGWNGETQQGYVNLGEYLKRIVPTFRNVTQVVLAGVSAGGLGVAWNWMRVQDAFGGIPVDALDDSGPPFAHPHFTTCMQQRLAALWNWKASLHPACRECDVAAGNVVVPLARTALLRNPERRLALLSYHEDTLLKAFFAYGLDDCRRFDPLLVGPIYPYGLYAKGLAELRQRHAGQRNFGLYEVRGLGHVFLFGDIGLVNSGGVNLANWIQGFIAGTPGWAHVVP